MAERNIFELIKKYELAMELGKSVYLDADEFGDLAEYFDSQEEIDTARDLIDAGLKIHPENASLLIKKAKFALYDAEYTKALRILSSYTTYDLDLYLIKIECFLQLDLIAEAYQLTKEVLENEDSDLANVLAELGFLYVEADHFNEALLYFLKSLEYDPDNMEVLSDLAYAYEMIGDYDGAIETSNKILDIDSYSYESWVNIGKLYSLKEEFEKAIDAFDFALTINDSDESIMKLKAHCLSLSGRPAEAIEIFVSILKSHPNDMTLYFLIAESYETLGMYGEALHFLEIYETINGASDEVTAKKIDVLMQAGDMVKAEYLANEALANDDKSLDISMVMAEIKMKEQKYDEAKSYLLKIYPDHQDNFHLLDMLAIIYIKKEDYAKGIHYTEQILDLDPYNLSIKQRLALLYFEIDDKEQFNDVLEQFTDKELLTLFKFIYIPTSDDFFDRERLVFYLNEARECRTLFKNIKY